MSVFLFTDYGAFDLCAGHDKAVFADLADLTAPIAGNSRVKRTASRLLSISFLPILGDTAVRLEHRRVEK